MLDLPHCFLSMGKFDENTPDEICSPKGVLMRQQLWSHYYVLLLRDNMNGKKMTPQKKIIDHFVLL